jgi:hypothetical protein
MSKNKKDEEKEESTLKEISLTPLLTAIFKPSAEYIGKELKEYLKSKVEELKENRRENNLKAHIEIVREKIEKTPNPKNIESPTFMQLEFFDEWVNCVQDVDPEEVGLSEIWENLLLRASQGNTIHPELLSGVKKLTPKEAKFLAEFEHRVPTLPFLGGYVSLENKYLAKSLESKGFLEKDFTFTFIFIPTILFTVYVMYYYFEVVIGRLIPIQYVVALGGGLIFAFALTVKSGFSRWRRSWLGVEILRLVEKA